MSQEVYSETTTTTIQFTMLSSGSSVIKWHPHQVTSLTNVIPTQWHSYQMKSLYSGPEPFLIWDATYSKQTSVNQVKCLRKCTMKNNNKQTNNNKIQFIMLSSGSSIKRNPHPVTALSNEIPMQWHPTKQHPYLMTPLPNKIPSKWHSYQMTSPLSDIPTKWYPHPLTFMPDCIPSQCFLYPMTSLPCGGQ